MNEIDMLSKERMWRKAACDRSCLLILILASCGEDGAGVSGRYVDEFFTPAGRIERPHDVVSERFHVFANGTWYPEVGPIEGAFDGTVFIPDVPPGPYVIRTVTKTGLSVWEQREPHEFIDVTSRVGRPDATPATHVPLKLSLQGLTSWGETDYLSASSWEVGTAHDPIQQLVPPIAVGAAEVSATFDWGMRAAGQDGAYLLSGDMGDTLTISHIVTERIGDLALTKITQVASGPAVSQRDNEPSSFTGTFVDVPTADVKNITVDIPGFAAQLRDVERSYWGVSVLKSPGSSRFETFGPALWSVSQSSEMQSSEPASVVAAYGDPFEPSWQLLASGGYGGSAQITLPSGASTSWGSAFYSYESRFLDGASFLFAPTNQFVETGTLNGQPLLGDIGWDGESVLSLHIDVPIDNRGFSAWVYRVTESAANAQIENWTYLRSDSSDVTLPREVFKEGEYFLLRVHVGKQTDVSRSGAFSILGPFRLISR